jgi:hypothetical protein
MKLSNEAITKFKKIYYETFAINLTDEEANERGLELLNFVKLIAKPIPKNYENK